MSTPAFDPDAYLKAKAEFDPDAYLATPPAEPPQPKVGAAETFALRGSQALPAGGLLSDLLSTGVYLALRPSPGAVIPEAAKAELAAMGVQVEEPKEEGAIDAYRGIRDTRRLRTAAGSGQNPKAARAGTGLGIAATIAAPFLPKFSPAQGAGALGRIGAAAKTGGAYGALSGLTEGESDLTQGDVTGVLKDTAEGAAFGTVLGGAAGGAAEGIRPAAAALRQFAVRQGKQAIQGGSDIAAATRKPLSDEAVGEALEQGAIRAGDTTGAIYDRLRQLAQERGAAYGRILRELEGRGVPGPEIEKMADELYALHVQASRVSGADSSIPDLYRAEGDNLRRLARYGPYTPALERFPLSQAEELKRGLQRSAKYDRLRNTGVEEARQDTAYVVRKGIDDAVAEAGAAPGADPRVRELAGQFNPVKEQLGRLLEARRFAELGAAKAEGRSTVGLLPTMMGFATSGGNPVQGAAQAAAFSFARNRTPSTLASGAFDLSEGLRTGSLAGDMAGGLAGAAELGVDEVQSRADGATIDDTTDPLTAALIRALRSPKKKNQKEKR